MNSQDLALAISGAILFGFLLIGAFFWRFWTLSREKLFLFFSIAFCLLAIERLMLLVLREEEVDKPVIYATRLIAFLVIIGGIWEANRRKPRE